METICAEMSFFKNHSCFVKDFVHFLSLNLEQCVKKEKKKEKKMAFFIYICTTVVLSSCPEKYGANFSRIRILDENDFAFAVSVKCCRLLCFSKNALEED